MDIQTKWFAEATPTNATNAKAVIGSGTNGTVTITYDSVGTEGNSYDTAVVIASGANADMTAILSGTTITITLGTGASAGVVSSAKNTATLIANAISALDGFTAVKSGTGADSIEEATSENIAFAGGLYGTFCPVPYTWLYIGGTYYTNIAPNGVHDANWRTVTFTAY